MQVPPTGPSKSLVSRSMRPMRLRAIAGPVSGEFQADPENTSTLGRDASAELRVDHPTVSRQHARVAALGGQWMITDLGSHNGTYLCGQRLVPDRPTPLQAGDEVRIGACMLRVLGSERSHGPSTLALSEAPSDRISKRGEDDLIPAAGREQMRRLADAAVALGACGTLAEIAERAVEELLAGSQFENAVFVEATPDLTLADALASKSRSGTAGGPARLSRSLLSAAIQLTEGRQIVSLADRPDRQWGVSIQELAIASAVAAPVIADGRVMGVLYGDVRRSASGGGAARDEDAWFILGLAHVCAMALSRLQIAEVRRRVEGMERDLKAARIAQRAILPPPSGAIGRVRYTSLFVPGQHVAGDFFDVLPMADGRVVCLLGDVCGHGVAAALIMASLLTHLRDRLIRGETLPRAIDSANRLMAALNESREPAGFLTFATLFAAVLHPAEGVLQCVDCGHGYAAILRAGGTVERIRAADALPLGITPEQETSVVGVPLGPGDGLVVCSDGAVEQPGAPDGSRFGIARVLEFLGGREEVEQRLASLHQALAAHAGVELTAGFQDDVTILSVMVEAA
jgi:serine phosphatase RsbU (regulator of sigma subunit)